MRPLCLVKYKAVVKSQMELYITSSTRISQQRVFKDEQLIFQQDGAETSAFLIAAYRNLGLNYPKFFKMDSLSRLGWLAAEILLKDSLDKGKYEPDGLGVVLQNANSSLDTDLKYFESTHEMASPALFVYTLPNIVIGEICIRHKFKGENAFFIFDAFDAGFMEKYINGLMNKNILQACVCGWVELLGEEYKAVLYLVESGQEPRNEGKRSLTKENLNNIYQLENG